MKIKIEGEFKKLDEEELRLVDRILNRLKFEPKKIASFKKEAKDKFLVGYYFQDNFTTAVVIDHKGYLSIGVAKCNPKDHYAFMSGCYIAFTRAIEKRYLSE